jgi:hypothetical protein
LLAAADDRYDAHLSELNQAHKESQNGQKTR